MPKLHSTVTTFLNSIDELDCPQTNLQQDSMERAGVNEERSSSVICVVGNEIDICERDKRDEEHPK